MNKEYYQEGSQGHRKRNEHWRIHKDALKHSKTLATKRILEAKLDINTAPLAHLHLIPDIPIDVIGNIVEFGAQKPVRSKKDLAE